MLPPESAVLVFSRRLLLGEERKGSPNAFATLLQNRSNGYSRSAQHKAGRCTVHRIFQDGCIGECFLCFDKSNGGYVRPRKQHFLKGRSVEAQ